MAFTKGSRKCLGIELASAELCLVIAALVRTFDMTLYETDARDVSFEHDYQVAMPKMGSKGVRATVRLSGSIVVALVLLSKSNGSYTDEQDHGGLSESITSAICCLSI
ncbi:cytochrome P450 [Penicillium chermesinum]|uniref:Cytochrome P450 n=1 Tax=Penicillium chermesinum TaxID=63820 RepID=A0A9W9TKP8_9EURO|nr:cytochrome P450 [Penicillium chermesinum]KAJ5226248.1 cytochrome P450 [Penicillium chermesinum]